MKPRTVVQAIASTLQAMRNCDKSGNGEWWVKHRERLATLEREHLPSGSGVDSGTTINRDKSTADRLVLSTSFHHMHESGMYDGWTSHQVIVRPTFDGLDVRVTGRDRNQIKDYLGELYHEALSAELPEES